MDKPKTQFRLWHLFEATAWVAVVVAIGSQINPWANLLYLPYAVAGRWIAWDGWHGEWRTALACLAIIVAGLLWGLAFVGMGYLLFFEDQDDVTRSLLPFTILGSWVGSNGAIFYRSWWSHEPDEPQ